MGNGKNEDYVRGLSDAWELAKKIYDMKCEDVKDIFEEGFWEIINHYTAEEALAKIEAYEKEKEIKVGDVVVKTSGAGSKYIGVVTQITDAQYSVCLVFSDGSTETTIASNLTKTGKHIDIESLLKQIGA